MKESKKVFSVFLAGIVLIVASTVYARNCENCNNNNSVITSSGGLAFASFNNGATFTWADYVAPVVNIVMDGTSTTVTTQAGYFKNSTSTKFIFNNDLYTWTSKNKINPDVKELQKVLVAEGLLGTNSQTGVYDITTRTAVEAFQKKHGIKPAAIYPYGYFGPLTRGYLNKK